MILKKKPNFLKIFDGLPSLLEMASERARETGGYVYDIQDELEEEFTQSGRPFRKSIPYRSLFECFQCGYVNTQVQHWLVIPGEQGKYSVLHGAALKEEDLHHIREHGADFSEECQQFLLRVISGDNQ